MIPFDEAQEVIRACTLSLGHERKMVGEAQERFLFSDITAPIDLPSFDNSAVDGFALNTKDISPANKILKIDGYIKAQAQGQWVLREGCAVEIATGAPLPEGANAAIMREDVEEWAGMLHLKKEVSINENLRLRGEDVRRGQVIAQRGDKVTPKFTLLLYSLGIRDIEIFKSPRIKIISTGDELVEVGRVLDLGQAYYSVGPMLKAQCAELGISDVTAIRVADDVDGIVKALEEAIEADLVLITGGMSKGDYDLVRPALKRCRVEQIFYQGAWRPGRPTYFGRKGKSYFFGLPGNPVASFVGFLLFIKPLILGSMDAQQLLNPKIGMMKRDFIKREGFSIFARARIDENHELDILNDQGSHHMLSLSRANALCLMTSPKAIVKAGELVHYHDI